MAATKQCKKCFSEIDRRASVCPHCRANQGMGAGMGCLVIIVLFIVGGFMADSLRVSSHNEYETNPAAPAPAVKDYESEARTMAEFAVKRSLKAPATAEFSGYRDTTYYKETGMDGKEYHVVTGYVDAENSFGAKLRNSYFVKLRRDGDELHYVDIKVGE
jgi:hypothetical protein